MFDLWLRLIFYSNILFTLQIESHWISTTMEYNLSPAHGYVLWDKHILLVKESGDNYLFFISILLY